MDQWAINKELAKKEKRLVGVRSSGDIRTVIAYPNRYWLAMSNLGFQTVYRLFAGESRFRVERAYLPEEEGASCRTFESNEALSNADILAVSVSFETDYLNVLRMLEQAGLNLEECLTEGQRDCSGRPFILGGGAAITLNPEPLSCYFDAICIGEAEEVVPEIARVYAECRTAHAPYSVLLDRLSQIEGVYVPSLYTAHYRSDGTVDRFESAPGAPSRVKRRYLNDIDKYPTYTVIQTPETEFKAMFMTETGRGCEVGCRFCVSGYMYRPTRKRSEETVSQTLQVAAETSEAVGFVGAAVSSHPAISKLASSVARQGKRASLSSVMSQKVTDSLAASLSESEYKSLALAPEAGSEKLRFRIGKLVPDEQILLGVRRLAANGIRSFKLYFMVGLPSEEVSDVEDIPRLVERIREASIEGARSQQDFSIVPTIQLSVNPFIPKAWTPFQRHGFMEMREVKRRIKIVQNGIRRMPNVEMKYESPRESYFQALVSRGDRRISALLLDMYRNKRDWRWLVQHGSEILVEGVPAADFYVHRMFGRDEVLPWEMVDLLIKRTLLEREYEKTFSENVDELIARKKAKLAAGLEVQD